MYRTPLILVAVLLSACAPLEFYPHDDGSFTLAKTSDLCAAGMASSILADLRTQAKIICVGRREQYREIYTSDATGIPLIQCASASLVFRCEPMASSD